MTIHENNALARRIRDKALEQEVFLPIDRAELVPRAWAIIEGGGVPIEGAGKSVVVTKPTEIQTPDNEYDVFFIATNSQSGMSRTTLCVGPRNKPGEHVSMVLDYCEDLDWIDAYAAGEIIVEVEKVLAQPQITQQ